MAKSISRLKKWIIGYKTLLTLDSKLQGVIPAKPGVHSGKTTETQFDSKHNPSDSLTLSINRSHQLSYCKYVIRYPSILVHHNALSQQWIIRAVSCLSLFVPCFPLDRPIYPIPSERPIAPKGWPAPATRSASQGR